MASQAGLFALPLTKGTRQKACTLMVVLAVRSAQTRQLGIAMAFLLAALPPLCALPSIASTHSGACTIFRMAKLAGQIDNQLRAASALLAPGPRSLVGRGLRRQMGRDVDARAPWRGIAEVALAALTAQAGLTA